MSSTAGIRKTIAALLIWLCLGISDLSMAAHDKLKAWSEQD